MLECVCVHVCTHLVYLRMCVSLWVCMCMRVMCAFTVFAVSYAYR